MSITTQAPTHANTRIVRFQGGGLRFLDATWSQVITRPLREFDDSQYWRVTELGGGVSTIQQVRTGRFLDTDAASHVTTRGRADSEAQRWRIDDLGGGFATIQQVSSGRFLEATIHGDFSVVLRTAGSNEQTWRIGDP